MRFPGFLAFLAVSCLIAGCGEHGPDGQKTQAPSQGAAAEPVPKGKLPADVTPSHYRIALNIFPETERFSGRTAIDVTLTKPRAALYLHGRDLHVTRAEIVAPDGTAQAAAYRQVDESGVAELRFAHTIPAGKATLVLDYDAPFSTSLAGLYKVNVRGEAYAFSQLEAIQARRVFPAFDEPRFKTTFDIVITAHGDQEIVSNTSPEREEGLPDGSKRVTFKPTPQLPTYLLTFAVGPLDIVQGPDIPANEFRRVAVPLRGVTVHGKGDQIAYALNHTPAIVQILERYFGRAYPFAKLDIIAAPDFAPGAMENAGAIVYRETLMLMDENSPLEQRRRFAYVHAHELSHQWFGDLVTPAWWEDIWLNEAFATWLGHRATAEWFPNGEYGRDTLHEALSVMELDSLGSARRVAEPVSDSNGIANAFDGITYSKGAAVLSMFENYLGPEKFRDGVRLYVKRFAGKNAATGDFLQALAEAAQRPDIVPAFASFLDRTGVPMVDARAHCEGGAGGRATLSQSAYAAIGAPAPKTAWRIPVCVRALDGKGRNCTLLDAPEKEIKLGLVCSGALMPNAGGAGYYRFSMDAEGWRALIGAFEKLDAAEQSALIANLDAGFRAGTVSAPLLLEGLRVAAAKGAWDGVAAVADILERYGDTMIAPENRVRFEAFARALLRGRWEALGLAPRAQESDADSLLRQSLAWFLAKTARDTSVRAGLAKGGRAYVQSQGGDGGGVSPDLLTFALWSFVADGGAAAGTEALTALKDSNNAEFRQALVFALSASGDAKLLPDVYAAILSDDLRVNESNMLLGYLLGDRDQRAGAWDWTKAHIDALEKRFTPMRMAGILHALSGACDAGLRGDVDAFFRPRAERYDGAPRQLALTLEEMDRCIALKNAKGAELAMALSGARR